VHKLAASTVQLVNFMFIQVPVLLLKAFNLLVKKEIFAHFRLKQLQ